MIDEIYDVFDRAGNKVGQATWTECHTKGFIHRCASALIFKNRSKQETLIQQRSANMSQHPKLWTHAVGGHVLAGDTMEEGIRKELQEELFWNHSLPNLVIKKIVTFFNHDMPNNNEFLTLFEVIYSGPFFYNPTEVAKPPEWIAWPKLIDDMRRSPAKYTPVFHKIIDVYEAPAKHADGPQF